MRVAAWCAVLVIAAGAAMLTGVLLLTQQTLNDNVPKPSLAHYSQNPIVLRSEEFSLIARDQLLVNRTVGHVRTVGLLGLGGLALLSLGIGWVVAGRMLRPATRLADAARSITSASLGQRIGVQGPQDELKSIGDALDEMLERLDGAFSRQRRFVADASHELRTPFAVMRSKVDVALDDRGSSTAELRAALSDVGRVLDRGSALVDAMLALSRAEALARRERVDLADLVRETITAFPGTRTLSLHADLEPAIVLGDPVLLAQLITNLVENAIAYNVPGGRLEAHTHGNGDSVTLRIANDGDRLEQDEVASLFMRFHRGDLRDRASGGFGLGLAVVDTIVRAHDGTLEATAREHGGLEIAVTLPREA